MADKPRLKDSDEILSALRGGKPKAPPAPIISGRELPNQPAPAPETAKPAPPAEPASSSAEAPAGQPAKKTVKRKKKKAEPAPELVAAAESSPAPPEDEDANPLDFGRYKLPDPPQEEPAPPARPARGSRAARPAPEPVEEPAPPVAPTVREEKPARGGQVEQVLTDQGPKLIQPYQFEDLSAQPLAAPAPEPAPPEEPPAPKRAAKPRTRPKPAPQPEPEAALQAKPEDKAKTGPRTADKSADAVAQEQAAPNPEPDKPGPRSSAHEQFLQELSSRFDEAFNQRFEGRRDDGPPSERPQASPAARPEPAQRREQPPVPDAPEPALRREEPAARPDPEPEPFREEAAATPPAPEPAPRAGGRRRRAPDLSFTPRRRTAAQPEPEPELEPEPEPLPEPEPEPAVVAAGPPSEEAVDAEADSFLEQFTRQVREEEAEHAEEFKDTLAQKFERERARYLRELGIPDEEAGDGEAALEEEEPEEAGVVPPQRRRLDLHIRPEMHGAAPVTYSRDGAVRPLDDEDDGQTDEDVMAALEAEAALAHEDAGLLPEPEPDTPKTPEQLLLELGAQNSVRRLKQQHIQQRALERQAQQKKFTFAPPAGGAAPERESNPGFFRKSRVIALSSVAALLILTAIAIPLAGWLNGGDAPPGGGISDISENAEGTLVVRETRNPDTREEYDDVLIRRSNISVSNLSVGGYLVIEDIPSNGSVHLENLTVGGAIYLNNCAVNALSLHNVSAQRVVVTNSETDVQLDISGAGLVQTLEVRTPATVTASPTLGSETMGVRDVLLRRAEDSTGLTVKLEGLDLVTLSSYGETVLELSDDTFIEEMNVEGSLALRGGGRVLNMTAGPDDEGHYTLAIQQGSVSRLNLKGAVALSLEGEVDSLAVADDLSVGGGGRITTMTVNARMNGGRILADLSGAVQVQSMIVNAEAQVNAAGMARVYELTANHSVYALGTKINHLIVNHENVIYENEPDKITVAAGVPRPESVADNPNLDLSLSAADGELPLQAEDDGVDTLCGHSRDNGGFLAGDGSRQNPYEVATAAQLAHINTHLDSHFIQVADIDIADDTRFITGFDMIGGEGARFSGSYDGGGYGISNLRISSAAENVGLFAENTGAIRNVTVLSGEVRSTSNTRAFVGGIVGLNYQGGLVEVCANSARVIGNNESSYVGGVAGYNFGGRVRNCYNTARVSNTASVGGVVGVNRDDGMVSGCYSVGIIEGEQDVGAVVGSNSGGIVANCYYLLETAADGIGAGVGTANGKTAAEFEGAQLVADLAAGSDSSPWTAGTGAYVYPVLRPAESDEGVEPATQAPAAPGIADDEAASASGVAAG